MSKLVATGRAGRRSIRRRASIPASVALAALASCSSPPSAGPHVGVTTVPTTSVSSTTVTLPVLAGTVTGSIVIPTFDRTGPGTSPELVAHTTQLQFSFFCLGAGSATVTPTDVTPLPIPDACQGHRVYGENFDTKVGSRITIKVQVAPGVKWEMLVATFNG